GHRFPGLARGISIARTVKREPGRYGEPVVCSGVLVAPGDVVVADSDGVVVVARDRAAEVLEKSRARAERELEMMARLREGELTLDLLGLRSRTTPPRCAGRCRAQRGGGGRSTPSPPFGRTSPQMGRSPVRARRRPSPPRPAAGCRSATCHLRRARPGCRAGHRPAPAQG